METSPNLKNAFLAVAIVCLPVLCCVGVWLTWNGLPGISGSHVTYSEFVSALLTAITIVLAALGFFLAIAAFWGYREISGKAKDAAGKAARAYLRGKQGQALLRGLVETAIEQTTMKRMAEADKIAGGFSEDASGLSKDSGASTEVDAYPENGGDQR
jgi:hypothetical protein